MLKVTPLSPGQSLRQLHAELGISADDGKVADLQTVTDLLRGIISARTGFSRTGLSEPIYITQLIRSARREVELTLSESSLFRPDEETPSDTLNVRENIEKKVRDLLELLLDIG